MKIEIKIDESCTEPKIVIVTDRVTDKINEIIKKLSVEPSEVLAGFRDEQVTVLEPNEIDRIYASGGKGSMPKRKTTHFCSACGCTKRSNVLRTLPSCAYQTARLLT